jgi:hypothetical protein
MAMTTLYTIPAPNTPPSKYNLFTDLSPLKLPSLTKRKTDIATKNPTAWIKLLVNHIPVFSVNLVLNTPCTLIKRPEKIAMNIPMKYKPPLYPKTNA